MIVLRPAGERGGFQFTKSRNKYLVSWSGEMIGDVSFRKDENPIISYWNSSQPMARVEMGVALLKAYLAAGGDPKSNL
jgi:hypothetical protein